MGIRDFFGFSSSRGSILGSLLTFCGIFIALFSFASSGLKSWQKGLLHDYIVPAMLRLLIAIIFYTASYMIAALLCDHQTFIAFMNLLTVVLLIIVMLALTWMLRFVLARG